MIGTVDCQTHDVASPGDTADSAGDLDIACRFGGIDNVISGDVVESYG